MAVRTAPAAEIAAATRVKRPAFQDKTIYSGPLAEEWQGDGTPTSDPDPVKTLTWYLRAFRGSGHPVQHLCVSVQYWSRALIVYTRSVDSEQTERPAVVVERKVVECAGTTGRCEYDENLSVALATGYLERHAGTGFRMTFTSRTGDGEFTLFVPPNYVQGFLAAVPN